MTNQSTNSCESKSLLHQAFKSLDLDTYSFSYYQSLLSKGTVSYLADQSQKNLPPDDIAAICIAHEEMVGLLQDLEQIHKEYEKNNGSNY